MNDGTDNPASRTSRRSVVLNHARVGGDMGLPRRRSDLAYDHVKRGLLTGRFPPGGLLPVEHIAGDLEISRQPVMEALKRLAGEGFVTIIPQVGCQAVLADPETVGDHFRLFAATEALLAELAADRWQGLELANLQDTSATIRRSLSENSRADTLVNRYRLLNRELHENIHAMARAKSIADIARRLADLADFYIATMTPNLLQPLRAELAQDEHEVIVEKIASRDAAAAGKVMSAHILHFGRHVRAGMEAETENDA